jgi:hypothetical protein
MEYDESRESDEFYNRVSTIVTYLRASHSSFQRYEERFWFLSFISVLFVLFCLFDFFQSLLTSLGTTCRTRVTAITCVC